MTYNNVVVIIRSNQVIGDLASITFQNYKRSQIKQGDGTRRLLRKKLEKTQIAFTTYERHNRRIALSTVDDDKKFPTDFSDSNELFRRVYTTGE